MGKKSSIGGAAVKLTVSKMIVLLISMVTAMLLSRFRTVEEYGTYSQLMTVINLVTTIIMMGLPNSLNYFLAGADNDKQRAHFLGVYYSLNTILSAVVGFVLVMITPLVVKYFDNPLISSFMYFLAVFPWTKIIISSVENVLVVYNRANLIMAYRLLNSISLLLIILVVQFFSWTFNAYMILYLAVEAVFSIAVYILAKKCAGSLKIEFDWALTKEIFKFSIPIGIASMIGTLNTELDKLVIGGLMDTEKLAIYTNASKEMPVTIIATSVTAVLLPQMVKLLKKNENQKAAKLWGDATYLSFTIICFLAFALFVFAPEVMTILYSEKYLDGVNVFRIYNLVLLFRCTYFGMVLNSTGHTKFILYSSIGSLVLNICLNYAFFYLIGFEGPAVATMLALAIVSLLQLLLSAKVLKVKFSKLFEWKNLGKSLILNAVIAAVFFALEKVLPLEQYIGEIPEAIALGAVWTVVFALIEFKPLKRKWNELNSAAVD